VVETEKGEALLHFPYNRINAIERLMQLGWNSLQQSIQPLLHCKMPRPIGHIQSHCIKIISNFDSHSIEKGARDGF